MTDMKFDIVGNDRQTSAMLIKVAAMLDRVTDRMDKLDKARAEPTVEPKVDTEPAEREVGAFARKVQRDVEAAVRALPDIELGADASDVDRRIQEIRAALAALSDQRIGIDIDAGDAQEQARALGAELRALAAEHPSVRVQADVADAVAKLGVAEEAVDRLDGRVARVKVTTDRSLMDTINGVARLGGSLQTLAMPATLLASTPQVASLGSAVIDLSGALGLVPAAGAAAGVALGTVAVGLAHVADALGPTDTAAQLKKVNEAMAKLSPNARAVVTELRGFGPAWSSMRLDVQTRLFTGVSGEVKALGATYLPVLRKGLVGTAGELNLGAVEFSKWARSAGTVRDVSTIIDRTKDALREAAPAGTNFAAALTDIATVGSDELPELASGLNTASVRFREFIAQARQSGQLQQWIDTGIDKVEQLGSVAMNTGGILVNVFGAADRSGADFLGTIDELTAKVDRFFDSAEGQEALNRSFSGIGDTVDELEPGLEAVGHALMDVLGNAADVAPKAAEAISATAKAAAPLVVSATDLARVVLGPLLSGLTLLAPVLTPVAGGLLAIVAASKLMGAVNSGLGKVSTRLADTALNAGVMTERLTGSAAAGEKVATSGGKIAGALGKVGSAIPLAGGALIGIGLVYDELQDKSDDFAKGVIDGSMSMQDAINSERNSIEKRNFWLGDTTDNLSNEDEARQNLQKRLTENLAGMSGEELARGKASVALADYNQKVHEFGAGSQQAVDAQHVYADATNKAADAQRDAAAATRDSASALQELQDRQLAAANADLGYQQSIRSREQAQKAAAAATRDHGAASDEAKDANLRLQQADLQVISAADNLTRANLTGASATDQSRIAAFSHDNTLLSLASGINGKASPALVDLASKMTDAQIQAHNAAVDTSGFHSEVRTLPDGRVVKIVTDSAVREMENTANLTDKLNKLPKWIPIAVQATGQYSIGASASFTASGTVGRADGGVLPGYTPGRDVHRFVGAAGALELSGGEAIMRPEWTRAVGPGYIGAANAAARRGGVAGVADFLGRTAPRAAGIEGFAGDGSRFARGGVVRRFAAGGVYPSGQWPGMVDDLRGDLLGGIASGTANEIKKYAASGGNALAWARTQVGKPYIWAATGPGGYDCSGFMSAIVNVMRGKNPYSRVGSTGTFPWPGFQPGIGPGLSIGAFRGDPGHMAGTIAGVNVESAGSVGVRVGGPVGAMSGMFNIRAHLPMANGGLVDRPTFGLIGEAGPELVLPLNRPDRAQQLARGAGLGAAGGGGVHIHGDVHIHKEVDADRFLERLNYLTGAV